MTTIDLNCDLEKVLALIKWGMMMRFFRSFPL